MHAHVVHCDSARQSSVAFAAASARDLGDSAPERVACARTLQVRSRYPVCRLPRACARPRPRRVRLSERCASSAARRCTSPSALTVLLWPPARFRAADDLVYARTSLIEHRALGAGAAAAVLLDAALSSLRAGPAPGQRLSRFVDHPQQTADAASAHRRLELPAQPCFGQRVGREIRCAAVHRRRFAARGLRSAQLSLCRRSQPARRADLRTCTRLRSRIVITLVWTSCSDALGQRLS